VEGAVKPLKPKREKERIKKGSRGGNLEAFYIWGWGEKASCCKVPTQCPLVLLMRIE
jgi:hypothetical protein